jgi:hypothetical protein
MLSQIYCISHSSLIWFGLFVHPFSHTCNTGHVNYILQFITLLKNSWECHLCPSEHHGACILLFNLSPMVKNFVSCSLTCLQWNSLTLPLLSYSLSLFANGSFGAEVLLSLLESNKLHFKYLAYKLPAPSHSERRTSFLVLVPTMILIF